MCEKEYKQVQTETSILRYSPGGKHDLRTEAYILSEVNTYGTRGCLNKYHVVKRGFPGAKRAE